MPVHVLKAEKTEKGWDTSRVLEWADEYVRGRDYAVLVTDECEVILEPRKSTRPLDYGYIKLDNPKDALELGRELARRYGLRLLEIECFRWDIEKPPTIRTPLE
jgi:hypothetical protein